MFFKISQLKLQSVIACVLTALGIILIICGFFVPPLGVIDSSVLIAYGETLTFVGALVGVDYTYRYKEKIHK